MNRAQLVELLEQLDVRLASRQPNSGGYLPCLCPLAPYLHERGIDSHPSFFVRVEDRKTSGWHCFTCKQKGSRISSLIRKLGYYREDDYSKLAMQADLSEIPDEFDSFEDELTVDKHPDPLNPAAYDGLYPSAWEELESRSYLMSRKIGEEASEVIGLKFDPEERRILFPIQNPKGDLYGFTGRTIVPPDKLPKGYPRHRDYSFKKEWFLLGEHLVDRSKPVWMVEGLFAFARMVEIGARKHVNPLAPMMSSLSDKQASKLVDIGQRVYVCFDLDQAGDAGMYGRWNDKLKQFQGGGVIDKLKSELTVLVPPYPDTVSDIDEVTHDDFLWMLDEAELQ